MGYFTLTAIDRFPTSTSITVYRAEQAKLGQAPSGSSTTSGTMGASSVTFTGLDAHREYVAYAVVNGQHRYSTFKAQPEGEVVFSDRGRIDTLERTVAGFKQTETVEYGIPSDYPTLQAAFDDLGPRFGVSGTVVQIRVEAGHALTAGLYLKDGDFGHFEIVSDDATVLLASGFVGAEPEFEDLMRVDNAVAPRWSLLADMNGQGGRGLSYWYASRGYIDFGCGVIDAVGVGATTAGLYLNASTVSARGAVFTGCGYGAWVSRASSVDMEGADVSNATTIGLYASRASCVTIAEGTATGCEYGVVSNGGLVTADLCDVTGCDVGLLAERGGTIRALSAVAANCTVKGVHADSAGTVEARLVDATGCPANNSFVVSLGGKIDRTDATPASTSTGLVGNSVMVNWQRREGLITDNAQISFPAVTSDSNGRAVRYPDGTMVVTHQLVCTMDSTARCRGTWTFPQAFFDTDYRISAVIRSESSAPTFEQLGAINPHTLATGSVIFDVYRISGMTNFVAAETVTLHVTAIGRWY